jgi:F-type H+-transporting ATPase subunit alpha
MVTGVTVVDSVVPIAWGQRELVIGDRKTGKTDFLMSVALTQLKLGRLVVYCMIGKRKSEIKAVHDYFLNARVLQRCIIVASEAYSTTGEIYLTPYTAMSIAEYFRDKGGDILLILDDLTTHAKYYREIALLSQKFPGRESYPGDIFYIHSRLMERAGCFKINGGSSITCLPVAESVGGDITGYIQTNLMSMTDGHIYFDTDKFYSGVRPAVNTFLSVTRVGKQTQTPLMREIGFWMMTALKDYEEVQRFKQFGTEMTQAVLDKMALGEAINRFFTQRLGITVYPNLQVILSALLFLKLWNGDKVKEMSELYVTNFKFKETIDKVIVNCKSFTELTNKLRFQSTEVLKYFVI